MLEKTEDKAKEVCVGQFLKSFVDIPTQCPIPPPIRPPIPPPIPPPVPPPIPPPIPTYTLS